MKKSMDERSTEASSQDGQAMRFSDEVTVAEVARLLCLVQRRHGGVTDWGGAQGDESGVNGKWRR